MTTIKQVADAVTQLYRALPSINELLQSAALQPLIAEHGRPAVLSAAQQAVSKLRGKIAKNVHTPESLSESIARLPETLVQILRSQSRYSLRPVINATGVLLHTNLGRAPLSESALAHIAEVARDYCNLEVDIESGERSRRDVHVESLLLRVLAGAPTTPAAHSAVIVNNCAAATFLALNTLAERREVIVSRGELVEIGGGFRIPEILAKSGATLREIGTTNRTRIADYERAITADTALILRVHRSNFSMQGFTHRPSLSDLIALSTRTGIPLFEDQGTGLLTPLEPHGIHNEPTLPSSFLAGVPLIAASGDKLLGGPQCGLLIGQTPLIDRIRTNPLLRTFRVDKLIYAALEATLLDCLDGNQLPLQRMIAAPAAPIRERCMQLAQQIANPNLHVAVVETQSVLGGGSAPSATLPSYALALTHATLTPDQLATALRQQTPPIFTRIADDAVLLDLRTVPPHHDDLLATLLSTL